MATIVQLKRSEVAARQPSSADIDVGELAVNLADAKLYTKKSDGTIVALAQTTNNTTSYYLPGDLGDLSTAGNTYNLGEVSDSPSADNAGFNELTASSFTLGDQIFPTSDGTSGQVITTDGNGNLSWSNQAGGGSGSWAEKDANYTLSPGDKIIVDTDTSAITLTLPANPTLGDEVTIIDGSSNASINNITINRNGRVIDGEAENLIIDVDGAASNLVYYNSTYGWIFTER